MIGIRIRDLTAPEAIRGYQGIVVTEVVPDSSAGKLLRPGDLIVGVNNTRVSQASELISQLPPSSPPQNTILHIQRDGSTLRVELPPSRPE